MKIKISLDEKDWLDLVNFVGGDLANMMDEASEKESIKSQMTRICETIKREILKWSTTNL